jgi:hypothetical protein
MSKIGKVGALFISSVLSISLLTGCMSSSDKEAAKDTADKFLSIVASGTTEGINDYCNENVATGDFVKLFDSEYLSQQILEDQDTSSLSEDTLSKLDEVCNLFSNMVTGYEIKEVKPQDDGSVSVVATITTDFPVDIIKRSSTSEKVLQSANNYSAEHEEEINTYYQENGEEATQAKILNDIFILTLDTYEEEIAASSPQDYAIVLKLEKNKETDSFLITDVTDYVSAAEGATAAAEETSVE